MSRALKTVYWLYLKDVERVTKIEWEQTLISIEHPDREYKQ